MQYVNLGRSGLKVSKFCLGMMTYGTPEWRDWVLNEQDSIPIITRALELGINFFDTADMYSNGVSEEITGRILKKIAKREEVVIATKAYFPMGDKVNRRGLSRKYIMHAVEDSLRRLGTDYIDLYQIHRWDYETPIEETMETLHDLVKSGKVRYLGASSMYAWQFSKAQYTAELNGWTKFISMQNHYNLVFREEEREVIPMCQDMGVGIIPWSPLARGFLSGTRTRNKTGESKRAKSDNISHTMYFDDNDFDILDQVISLAKQKKVSPSQIALAWVLKNPAVTAPIIGASKLKYLEEAIFVLENVHLSNDECKILEKNYRPHPMVTVEMNQKKTAT